MNSRSRLVVATVALMVSACGTVLGIDDLSFNASASGGGGHGGDGQGGDGGVAGDGGAATGGADATSTSNGTTSSSGTGGTPICNQGCAKADGCVAPGACQFVGVDCAHRSYDCHGQCVLDADCAAIQTLVGDPPDGPLTACLADCGGLNPCFSCTARNCEEEVVACQTLDSCRPFLACIANCPDGDDACTSMCTPAVESSVSQDLIACSNMTCAMDCGQTAP